jgi:hypothetical protein
VKKEDWIARLGRTLFPRADEIPQSLAMAFMRMMMAHAKFESEVCALQGVVANDRHYGEQPEKARDHTCRVQQVRLAGCIFPR